MVKTPPSAAQSPPKRPEDGEIVFYDGECGLCHGFVRFILAHDDAGVLRVAPLHGRTFEDRIDAATRATLPDSLCVLRRDGVVLTRSRGAAHVLERLGGIWRLPAAIIRLTPRRIADGVYNVIAANRRKLGKPPTACPTLPAGTSGRLLP